MSKKFFLLLIAPFLLFQDIRSEEREDILVRFVLENSTEIKTILSINNADSLEKYFDNLPVKDIVLQIIYCSKYLELRPNNKICEINLLKNIPKSEIELSYFYRLTYQPFQDKDIDDKLNEIFCNYFEVIPRLINKHRAYIDDYFRLGFLVDGELGEMYASWCSWLLERDCVWFLSNLMRTNSEIEASILGLFELDMPDISCIRKCKSKIPEKYLKFFQIE